MIAEEDYRQGLLRFARRWWPDTFLKSVSVPAMDNSLHRPELTFQTSHDVRDKMMTLVCLALWEESVIGDIFQGVSALISQSQPLRTEADHTGVPWVQEFIRSFGLTNALKGGDDLRLLSNE